MPETRLFALCEIDGHLALCRGFSISEEEPLRTIYYLRAQDIKAAEWPNILGCQVHFSPGDGQNYRGSIFVHGRQIIVDANNWPEYTITETIPKPRDGKEYTWRWAGSFRQWEKDNYTKCAECGHYHNPRWVYAETPEGYWQCQKPRTAGR
jgi:hypothetical protein